MALIERLVHHAWEIAILVGLLSALLLRRLLRRRSQLANSLRLRAGVALTAQVLVGVAVALAVVYLLIPQYNDHIEPQVVITALNGQAGLPYHPDWTRGQGAYGVLYGPFLYEVESLALGVSRSVFASKLIPVLSFLLAMTVLWRMERIAQGRPGGALRYFYLLAVAPFAVIAFWVRSEPLLLAFSALAAASLAPSLARRLDGDAKPPLKSTALSALVIGLMAGLATATKAHGFAYLAPLAAYLVVRQRSVRELALVIVAGLAGALVGLAAPFGFDPARAAVFIKYLRTMAGHGLSPALLYLNATAAVVLAAPYALVQSLAWKAEGRTWRRTVEIAATTLSTLLVVVIGAKPGSGPHHLMPFIPVFAFLTLRAEAEAPKVVASRTCPWDLALVAGLAAGAIIPLLDTFDFVAGSLGHFGKAEAIYAEAVRLTEQNPGAQFGPTDNAHYRLLAFRTAAALAGARLTYDTAAWTDFAAAGVKPEDDRVDFDFSQPRTWILPKGGDPFSFISDYTKAPLYPERFRAAFLADCRQTEEGTTFAVWKCRPKATGL